MKWSNKTVLITGACGFIGQHLVRKLKELNANLICVDNLSLGKKENIDEEVEVLDVGKDVFSLARFKPQYIFHFGSACSVVQYNENPEKYIRETIDGFFAIIVIAWMNQAKIIYPSTGSMYGNLSIPQGEFHTDPQNMYAIGKRSCEHMASIASLSDIRNIGLRIFAGYGEGEAHKGKYSSPITLFFRDMIHKKHPIIWGDGTQTRDFVYITDVIDAIIKGAEVKMNGSPVINVGTGVGTNFNDIVSMLNDRLGKNIKPKYVKKVPKNYVYKTQADTHLMRNILEVKPMSIEQGLDRYVKYYKDGNKI